MEKRTVVITGGNSGLGYQCAKKIALNSKAYSVVIACRNPEKAMAAKKSLQQETGNSSIYALELDLASLDSIRDFCGVFYRKKYPPLYALVCNAGLGPRGDEYTNDGFEMAFGVNHLGHYLLVNLMLKHMVSNGRIVFVSSGTHDPPNIFPYATPVFTNARQLAYPDQIQNNASILLRYATSKLCNILCAYETASRLAVETDKHITVNAFNPAIMADTNLSSISSNPVLRAAVMGFMNLFGAILGRLSNSRKSGKALSALITESQYAHSTGKYYDRGKEVKSSGPSYDKTAAKNLWIESAELVNLKQSESILSIT